MLGLYPYISNTSVEVLDSLRSFYTSGLYALDFRSMRAVEVLTSRRSASFAVPHSFVVANVERSAKEGVEAPIHDDVTGKEAAAHSFYRQACRREEAWLTISQVDKRQDPLRAVFQTHGDDMLESLRVNR